MGSLAHNHTWDLLRVLASKTTLQNKWVYRLKEEDGGRKRYMCRLVVKGSIEKKGIDFDEIFSPVVKMTTIRTILSLVAVEDLHLEQLDVKTTFLHGDLEEEIYMQQPQGYEDLGATKQILGMRITRNRKNRKLTLSRSEYIEKVFKIFNMKNEKTISAPLASHFKLSKELCPKIQEEMAYMSKVPYASAVGSLTYAMVYTRPDIAHAVGVVSGYMNDPGKEHWMVVKWILRYLGGNTNQALCFGGSNIAL
eukprot:PITA_26327